MENHVKFSRSFSHFCSYSWNQQPDKVCSCFVQSCKNDCPPRAHATRKAKWVRCDFAPDRNPVGARSLSRSVAVVFVVDLMLPLGVAAAVPYTFAVLLALNAKSRWVGPVVVVLCMVLTLAKMELVPERGSTEMWKVIVEPRSGTLRHWHDNTAWYSPKKGGSPHSPTRSRTDPDELNSAVAGELATVLRA